MRCLKRKIEFEAHTQRQGEACFGLTQASFVNQVKGYVSD